MKIKWKNFYSYVHALFIACFAVSVLGQSEMEPGLSIQLLPSSAAKGNSIAEAISPNGRVLAVVTDASNWVLEKSSNQYTEIVLVDVVSGEKNLVHGQQMETNGNSMEPVFSPDNQWLAFSSTASNLLMGDGDHVQDIYLYHLEDQTLHAVTGSSTQANPDRDASHAPFFGTNPSFLYFESQSNEMDQRAGDAPNNRPDVFRYHLTEGTFHRLTDVSHPEWGSWDTETYPVQYAQAVAGDDFLFFESTPRIQHLLYLETDKVPSNLYLTRIDRGEVQNIRIGKEYEPSINGAKVSANGEVIYFAYKNRNQTDFVLVRYDIRSENITHTLSLQSVFGDQIPGPIEIAIDDQERLYALDTHRGALQWDPVNGEVVIFSNPGLESGDPFMGTRNLGVSPDGRWLTIFNPQKGPVLFDTESRVYLPLMVELENLPESATTAPPRSADREYLLRAQTRFFGPLLFSPDSQYLYLSTAWPDGSNDERNRSIQVFEFELMSDPVAVKRKLLTPRLEGVRYKSDFMTKIRTTTMEESPALSVQFTENAGSGIWHTLAEPWVIEEGENGTFNMTVYDLLGSPSGVRFYRVKTDDVDSQF